MIKNLFKRVVPAAFFAIVLFSAAAAANFSDVYDADPNLEAINYVQQRGIVAGYPNGSFQPTREINRAEFVKILIKTAFSDSQINSCNAVVFKDLEPSAWYIHYLCVAKQNRIVDGYPDGTFGPDNSINFAEAAKIITKTLRNSHLVAKQYPSGVWFEPYVRLLSDEGAIPVQILGPDSYLTPGQMAELIYRLDAKLTEKESLTYDELGDRTLIESYYGKIYGQDYEGAYAMKLEPEISFEAFKQMYKDFPFSRLINTKKVAAHTFDFYVMTGYPPNQKEKSELYHVRMEVTGGKLKTIFADPANNVVMEEVKFNDVLSAKIVWSDAQLKAVLVRDGKDVLVKEFDASESWLLNLKFSDSGNYFSFQLIGWEFGGVYLYDTVNNKVNDNAYQGTGLYGFDSQEKYFYFCSESGMGSGALFVLNMPGFGMRRDLYQESAPIGSCDGFDVKTSQLKYSLGFDKDAKSYVYDITTDKVSDGGSSV